MAIVYLSLGSNVGDRMDYLVAAEQKLVGLGGNKMLKKSKIHETEPWKVQEGGARKGRKDWFLNQVIKIETSLSPSELLQATQEIEKELGRKTKGTNGPREIDIDILLYDSEIIDSPTLEIPHRHMNDREFVLIPLLEIDPELIDPVSGKLYADMLREIKTDHKVTPFL